MARGKRLVYFRRGHQGPLKYYVHNSTINTSSENAQSFQRTSSVENTQEDDTVQTTDNPDDNVVIGSGVLYNITARGTFSDFSELVTGNCVVTLYNKTAQEYVNTSVSLVGIAASNVVDTAVTECTWILGVATVSELELRCFSAIGTFTVNAGISLEITKNV